MRIPRSFPCMGHTIKVRWKTKRDEWGAYDDDSKTIYLNPGLKKRPRTHLEQTFTHELMHCWLSHAGYPTLNADERFMEVTGGLLQQFLVSLAPTRKRKKR